jgi:hypothetical protein
VDGVWQRLLLHDLVEEAGTTMENETMAVMQIIILKIIEDR